MSGKRQHHVPQFLQKGFSSRPGGKRELTWVYRKESADAFETGIHNIGVEGCFYRFTNSKVDLSADDAITRAEAMRLSRLVRSLRNGCCNVEQSHSLISELLAHVAIRTKANWETMEAPAAPLFAKYRDLALDPQALLPVLCAVAKAHRPMLIAGLAPRHPGLDVEAALDALIHQLSVGEPSPDILKAAEASTQGPWPEIVSACFQMLKVQVMQAVSERPALLTLFNRCSFQVLDFPDARLVQGDAPVVFHRESGAGFAPELPAGEYFNYAFLPLTPTRVLVASHGGSPGSWEELQRASIACSYQHFISAETHLELAELASNIGSAFPVLTEEDIAALFAEALASAMSGSWPWGEADLLNSVEALASRFLPAPAVGSSESP